MIRVLPPEVVNQIAAGEVIERPFSVVKELVENSLDAGAGRITVELAEGGRAAIEVRDDGSGIDRVDLELAFTGHATSKLREAIDLERIASLGFRGEALASIGAVSRARIRSRLPGQPSGFEIACNGGVLEPVRPCGCPPGTSVEVRELFYNTPARRRFLRTPQAERARIQDLLARLALAHPGVDFTLQVDGRPVLRLPGGVPIRTRIEQAFGARLAAGLLDVARQSGAIRIEGQAGDPDAARRDGSLELLYVNGRLVRDRGVTAAIRQAYRPFLIHGRFPVYFLSLSLPPAEVDVNVHPAKAEVRFRDGQRVCGLLHEAVRARLAGRPTAAGEAGLAAGGPDRPRARSGFPDLPADLFGRVASPGPPAASDAGAVRERPAPPELPGGEPSRAHPFRDLHCRRFLQVLDLYLVLEVEDGMLVVDQHALHERVLYERLERRDRGREPRVQRLLVPEVLELTATDKEYLLAARETLAAAGLLLDDFGGRAIAVHGIPAVLVRAHPRALVESFLRGDADDRDRPRAREALLERFHSMACRGAVMSGDPLSEAEIAALLDAARELEHPHNCPHGRPTVLTFTRGELERFFRRRV